MQTTSSSIKLGPVSFSRLNGHQRCPFRFKNEPRQQSGVPAQIGDVVHNGIEAFLTGNNPVASMKKFALDYGFKTEDIKESISLYEAFANNKRYKMFERDKIIALESDDGETVLHGKPAFQVAVPVDIKTKSGVLRLALQGRFDMVYDRADFIEIWDWKTGWLIPEDDQMDFYAVAAYFKYWRPKKIVVRFALLRHGYATYKEYNENDILECLHAIGIQAAGYFQDEKFEPKLNPYCSSCTLKKTCAPFLEALTHGAGNQDLFGDITDYNQLEGWVEHLKVISKVVEKELESAKEKQKEMLLKGPIMSNKKEKYAYLQNVRSRPAYDTKAIVKAYEENGIPAWLGASFSKSEAIKQAEAEGFSPETVKSILEQNSEEKTYQKVGYKKTLEEINEKSK